MDKSYIYFFFFQSAQKHYNLLNLTSRLFTNGLFTRIQLALHLGFVHFGSDFFVCVPGAHLFPFVRSHNGWAEHCYTQFEGNGFHCYTPTVTPHTHIRLNLSPIFQTLFCVTCFYFALEISMLAWRLRVCERNKSL